MVCRQTQGKLICRIQAWRRRPLTHFHVTRGQCVLPGWHPAIIHWGRVTHICVSQLITVVSGNGLIVARPAPSHYLKQWLNVVIWTCEKKFQWNLNRNLYIFIHENAFENVVWKMAAILSWPQCFKSNLSDRHCIPHELSCRVMNVYEAGVTIACTPPPVVLHLYYLGLDNPW